MTKAIIFDLDGTLADLTHRLWLVTGGARRWDQFFEECDKDSVIAGVRSLLHIIAGDEEYKIIIVSGRSEVVREKTIRWLDDNDLAYYTELCMRKAGDYRQDTVVKSEILDDLLARGYQVELVIDDRPTVVAMWRKRGLTCLQCAEWEDRKGSSKSIPKGLLTLMIGPSGAGKSTWLKLEGILGKGDIHPGHIVSSDQIRADLCGDFKDQTRNAEVFEALYKIVSVRLSSGLPCVIDATNLKRADRMRGVELAGGSAVRYIVIDRPMEEKRASGGWRNELGFDLLAKHQQTFDSGLKAILSGDGLPNVTVMDLRRV